MGSMFSGGSTKLAKWAKPYAQQGLADAQNVFNQNQASLGEISSIAQDGAKSLASSAFGQSPFVNNAQAAANTVSGGFFLGQNPGQGTYDRLQQPGGGMGMPKPFASTPRDPSMGLLTSMATNQTPGSGTSMIRASANGANPGSGYAEGTAGGQYLNAQPSAGVYSQMMDSSYSTANPFLDNIIKQNDENVTLQANRLFGSRGMGAGIGSAYADVLSKNLANSGNQLRYQNYSDAENRRLQAAGQSDSAYGAERGRMMDAAGLLSSNFNAGQDRSLAAGQALNANDIAGGAQRLSAAQSLGGQFNSGADRALDRYKTDQGLGLQRDQLALNAATASDASQNASIAQILQSLGLTGELANAQYAGVAPTTDLLKTAATLPYAGLDSYQTALANILGNAKVTKGPGIGSTIAGGLASGVGSALGTAAMASDRRLKKNVTKTGELRDGLGVYEFEYIDGERFGNGRFKGVMADEVATLRPWALGPKIDGEYSSVDYSKLEAA